VEAQLERTIPYVPVAQLWLKHAKERELQAVMVFRGYIDESYDKDQVPKVFSLTCLVLYDNMWPWFEMAWLKVLEEKNAELKKQDRKLLSRYHAADCSSLHGEFKGWSVPEQIELSQKLFKVFANHGVHFHGFDIPLQHMVKAVPETAPNPIGFAYVILLIMLMDQIGKRTLSLYPGDNITLHHDHCDYDGALADTFALVRDKHLLDCADRFLSITPEWSNSCAMLQPADMIAYENFKEGMQYHYPNPKVKGRRKSLEHLLTLDSIGGRSSGFGPEAMKELQTFVYGLDDETRNRLFEAARINKK
jgi:hypothetical protein